MQKMKTIFRNKTLNLLLFIYGLSQITAVFISSGLFIISEIFYLWAIVIAIILIL